MIRGLRRIRMLLLGLGGLLLLPGCWNQRAIDRRAIVLAIAVSAHRQWTFLFPNVTVTVSSLSSLQGSSQFYPITVRANSYQEALHRVQLQSARDVSVGDLEVLLLSSRLTTDQCTRVIDEITLTGEAPSKFWVAAVQGSPATVLTRVTPQTVVPVYYLSNYFSCHGCHATHLGVRGWEWWDRRFTPGVSPILPVVDPTPTGVTVRQLLVYRTLGAPLLMSPSVTQGFAYLTGKVRKSVLPLTVDGQHYLIAPIRDHVSSRVTLTATAVDVRVRIHADGEIAALPSNTVMTPTTERAVNRAARRVILRWSMAAIRWANHTHTDPFGYAERAAWFQNAVAASLPAATLVTLPIHAQVRARVAVQGEGLAR